MRNAVKKQNNQNTQDSKSDINSHFLYRSIKIIVFSEKSRIKTCIL